MNRFTKIFSTLFIFPVALFSQVGGSSIYSFLNVSSSARVASMGGTFISVKDNDVNCALQNPALLNPSMDKFIAFSGVSFPAGIKLGDVAFAKDFKKLGTFDGYMHYANYGTFKETDVTGEIIGSFHAADYAFGFGWGYQLNKLFSVGANIKGVYSDYYIANSFGITSDIGATLADTATGWTASVVARNAGKQFSTYSEGNKEPLPVEALAGVSKRFAHVPFRISLTARHLEKTDITYIDPNDQSNVDPLTGESSVKKISFGKKIVRHFILGGEVLLSKNFHLRAAYNFQRRAELLVDTRPRLVGISFGAGIKISKFIISYGRSSFHLAGATNSFSLSANLGEFLKK